MLPISTPLEATQVLHTRSRRSSRAPSGEHAAIPSSTPLQGDAAAVSGSGVPLALDALQRSHSSSTTASATSSRRNSGAMLHLACSCSSEASAQGHNTSCPLHAASMPGMPARSRSGSSAGLAGVLSPGMGLATPSLQQRHITPALSSRRSIIQSVGEGALAGAASAATLASSPVSSSEGSPCSTTNVAMFLAASSLLSGQQPPSASPSSSSLLQPPAPHLSLSVLSPRSSARLSAGMAHWLNAHSPFSPTAASARGSKRRVGRRSSRTKSVHIGEFHPNPANASSSTPPVARRAAPAAHPHPVELLKALSPPLDEALAAPSQPVGQALSPSVPPSAAAAASPAVSAAAPSASPSSSSSVRPSSSAPPSHRGSIAERGIAALTGLFHRVVSTSSGHENEDTTATNRRHSNTLADELRANKTLWGRNILLPGSSAAAAAGAGSSGPSDRPRPSASPRSSVFTFDASAAAGGAGAGSHPKGSPVVPMSVEVSEPTHSDGGGGGDASSDEEVDEEDGDGEGEEEFTIETTEVFAAGAGAGGGQGEGAAHTTFHATFHTTSTVDESGEAQQVASPIHVSTSVPATVSDLVAVTAAASSAASSSSSAGAAAAVSTPATAASSAPSSTSLAAASPSTADAELSALLRGGRELSFFDSLASYGFVDNAPAKFLWLTRYAARLQEQEERWASVQQSLDRALPQSASSSSSSSSAKAGAGAGASSSSLSLAQYKLLTRQGIPAVYRARVWWNWLAPGTLQQQEPEGYYASLVAASSPPQMMAHTDITMREMVGDAAAAAAPPEGSPEVPTTPAPVTYTDASVAALDSASSSASSTAATAAAPAPASSPLPSPVPGVGVSESMSSSSACDPEHLRNILKDVDRTFTTHPFFRDPHGPGVKALQRVLVAYATRNPEVGYCQGMNFLAAFLLIFYPEEESFWMLSCLIEKFLPYDYFSRSMLGVSTDVALLMLLLQKRLPKLWAHLEQLECTRLEGVLTGWFLCAFLKTTPVETTLRIWDAMFVEGSKVLFRVGVALVARHEKALLACDDFGQAFNLLNRLGSDEYDCDALMKEAFKITSIKRSWIDKERKKQHAILTAQYAAIEARRRSLEEASAHSSPSSSFSEM